MVFMLDLITILPLDILYVVKLKNEIKFKNSKIEVTPLFENK